MKKILPFLLIAFCLSTYAQKPKLPPAPPVVAPKQLISKEDLQKLQMVEDTLHQLSDEFTGDTIPDQRKKACYQFIPKFVQALKTTNSFYYPFDSFETVAQIYPSDSTFRIFTWQLLMTIPVKVPAAFSKTHRDTFFEKPVIRYYGVIQMRSATLKMFPLFDVSDTLSYGTQQTLGASNWWGQLYYNIIEKTVNGKNYYTTFGFQAGDQLTRRKIIDIMTFDEKGNPKFGAPLFYVKMDADTQRYAKMDTFSRFFIEYKQGVSTVLNYDKNLSMIVFDHVAPPNNKAKGATFSYVPDGTYEGFVWQSNRWNWVEKVFTFAIDENDNPPIPVPKFGTPTKQPQMPGEDEKPK